MLKKSLSKRSIGISTLIPETSGMPFLLPQEKRKPVRRKKKMVFFIAILNELKCNLLSAKIKHVISEMNYLLSGFLLPFRSWGLPLPYENRFSAAKLSHWQF
jgi:hypothetical protein